MTSWGITTLVVIIGIAHAFMGFEGPLRTESVGLNPFDQSPLPTPAPHLNVHARNELLHKREWLSTCAVLSGSAITCPSPLVCAYNTPLQYMGCCSTDSDGSLLDPCVMMTRCVDQAESLSICSANTTGCPAFGPSTGVCGASNYNPQNGACLTVILYAGTYPWTTLECGAKTGIFIASLPPASSAISISAASSAASATGTTPAPGPSTTVSSSPSSFPSSSPSATPSPSPSPTPIPSPNHTAAIAGGVVGGVIGIALIVGAIAFIRHRVKVKQREAQEMTPEMSGSPYVAK